MNPNKSNTLSAVYRGISENTYSATQEVISSKEP